MDLSIILPGPFVLYSNIQWHRTIFISFPHTFVFGDKEFETKSKFDDNYEFIGDEATVIIKDIQLLHMNHMYIFTQVFDREIRVIITFPNKKAKDSIPLQLCDIIYNVENASIDDERLNIADGAIIVNECRYYTLKATCLNDGDVKIYGSILPDRLKEMLKYKHEVPAFVFEGRLYDRGTIRPYTEEEDPDVPLKILVDGNLVIER